MNNYNLITKFSDLEREEIRIKIRLRKQEEIIKEKIKTLPEEIVTVGITKLISGVLSGNIFKSAISIIKTIVSAVSENKKENPESSSGVIDIIKNVIKSKLSL